MDLSQYAESLRRELTSITRFAGEDIARAADMLSETLDSSVRLALLDVLSAAADEITPHHGTPRTTTTVAVGIARLQQPDGRFASQPQGRADHFGLVG